MSNFSPSPSGTVQRPDISMALNEHEQGMILPGMIGPQILPIQNVPEFAGNYGKFQAVQLAQDAGAGMLKRAAGGTYKGFDYTVTQANYETEEYGIKMVLDQRFMASYKYLAGGDMDKFRMIAAGLAQDMLLLDFERRIASAVFNATTFASNTTGVSVEWSTAATAVPTTDVKNAKESLRAVFGAVPEQDFVAIMSDKVRDNLRVCADIVNKVQYVRPTNQMDISDGDIARALGVGRLIVGGVMKPTHAQGAAASAFEDVWDDEYCMIAKLSPGGMAGIRRPGLGVTFHWAEDGSVPMGLAESYFDNDVRAEVMRMRHQTDEVIEIVNAGWLLSNITA